MLQSRANLGYVCINWTLSNLGIYTNRTMIKKTFLSRGKHYAGQLAYKNLEGLLKILEWNYQNDVKVFRMSSSLFPWMSEYKFSELHNYEDILKICQRIGTYAKQTNQRLSFHPGHHNCLASLNQSVVTGAIDDINKHASIMDMMNLEATPYSAINIHVGGAYGDKIATASRFCENFKKLQNSAQARLTIENDDKTNMYSCKDLYDLIYTQIRTPIVFDFFHHQFCAGQLSTIEALELANKTWPENIRQLTHHSSSRKIYEDNSAIQQAHADYVYELIEDKYQIDVEIEAKMKEQALLQYRKDFLNV